MRAAITLFMVINIIYCIVLFLVSVLWKVYQWQVSVLSYLMFNDSVNWTYIRHAFIEMFSIV